MTRKSTRPCLGCRNNFYNGNNELGVTQCWSLKAARLVNKIRVPITMAPPYDHLPLEKVYSCRSQSGYVFINPIPGKLRKARR